MENDGEALNKIYSFKTARNQKNILHKLADIGEKERLEVITIYNFFFNYVLILRVIRSANSRAFNNYYISKNFVKNGIMIF